MARPEKIAAVKEITERFEGSDAALLTEYRGLRVAEIAEVRSALREADAEYKVLKNTLARIAVREVGLDELVDMLEGPTAVVFVKGDVAAAAKALDEAAKKFPVLVVKGGAMQGRTFDADQAKALAKLEPREVLLTKIAMMMNSPAQQTANVLSALLRNLGSMLAQVVTKKESEDPAPVAETPAPTTDPAEGADEPSASADAGGPAEDAAAEADAGETQAEEPAAADDPAAEAAEEASAGEGAAPISSSEEDTDTNKQEEE
jgi:large subunit ribosomal protein L10